MTGPFGRAQPNKGWHKVALLTWTNWIGDLLNYVPGKPWPKPALKLEGTPRIVGTWNGMLQNQQQQAHANTEVKVRYRTKLGWRSYKSMLVQTVVKDERVPLVRICHAVDLWVGFGFSQHMFRLLLPCAFRSFLGNSACCTIGRETAPMAAGLHGVSGCDRKSLGNSGETGKVQHATPNLQDLAIGTNYIDS